MEDGVSQRRQRDNYDNRFHYPQSTRLPQQKDGPRRPDQFPPHPSVRVPPNVRTAARQVPAGVGVAPRPVMRPQVPRPQPRSQPHTPPAQPVNAGQPVQNFKFPKVPPPIPADQRQRLHVVDKARYNMHDSYVSSINDDSPVPRTTPNSRADRFPAPPRASSVYPDSEYADSPQTAYPSSRVMPPSEFQTPVPSKDVGNNDQLQSPNIATTELGLSARPKLGEISPASSRTTAMNALTAAIAAGFGPQQPSSGRSTPGEPPTRTFSPMRMPFESSDSSRPRTPEDKEDLEAPQLRNHTPASKHPQTPSSALSQSSTNPLLGLGINQPGLGMSSKVPVTKRPPKLDIDAVRDMEARGSTTSLAELIKRAAKAASNLDRGKTASRLNMLDMFGGSREKLGDYPGNRDSSMSDLMSAFPAPAAGGTPRRSNMWPPGEKGYLDEQQQAEKPEKAKRKCCGLSMPVFIAVLVIIFVLIAAAVLLPIFLILVPSQHYGHFDYSKCPTVYPCSNGGTSLVSNDACQCICRNGFVGAHCDALGSPAECTTTTVKDGSTDYRNATLGRSLIPAFSNAQSRFGVPLNSSTILSLFSFNSLSCVSENDLVDFNGSSATTSSKAKRFIMLPDLNHPAPTPLPTHAPLHARQAVSSNGIVFAASSTASSDPSPTDPALETLTSTSSTPTPTSTPGFTSLDIPADQASFAQVVVLYVLQRSSAISVAANAQQKIQSFFVSGDKAASDKVQVGFGALQLTANFGELRLMEGDGKVVSSG